MMKKAIDWNVLKRKGPHTDGVLINKHKTIVRLYVGNGKKIKAERVFHGTITAMKLFWDDNIVPKLYGSEILDNKPGEKFRGYIDMEYVGTHINSKNIPNDAVDQISFIEAICSNKTGTFMGQTGKYYHNDIDIRNFMIHNGKIKLIDLGLTSFGKRAGLGKNNFDLVKRQIENLQV